MSCPDCDGVAGHDCGAILPPGTELDRLRASRAEATTVIGWWEDVWLALGKPGRLGDVRAKAALAEVARLTPVVEAAKAWRAAREDRPGLNPYGAEWVRYADACWALDAAVDALTTPVQPDRDGES